MKQAYYIIVLTIFLVQACEFQKTEPPAGEGNKISVSTSGVTDITQYNAKIEGSLDDTYGKVVQDYGHCWDTNPAPDLSKEYTSFGNATSSLTFISSPDTLMINIKYYARAYFVVDNITVYGNEITFNTLPPSVPSVETVEIRVITNTSVECDGNVEDNGGATVTERGVCWSESQNPTTADSKILNGTGTGSYTCYITGLSSNTTYYVRGYAINSAGTGYGEEISFTTNEMTAQENYYLYE